MIARGTAARRLRWIGLVAWGVAVAAYVVAVVRTGSSPLDVLVAVVTFLRDHPLGALAFVAAYALRPLLLFSATLLTVGAGILYGPLAGTALVVLAANTSAVVAYGLGRAYGAEIAGAALDHPRVRGVSQRLRANAFEAVLTLRFVFTPYDAVNYLAGAMRLPLRPFIVATAIGSLPGTLVFVFFGAGLGDVSALEAGRLPSPDLPLLAVSAALFVTSLLLARVWRAREARRSAARAVEEAGRERAVVTRATGAAGAPPVRDDAVEVSQ
jgi:uncharacterized membrane protein YdjX (TVP38/TMEM64 family)